MYKVRLINNPLQEYSKYRDAAYEQFADFVEKYSTKQKYYKNGNRDYYFKNKDLLKNQGIISDLEFESIAVEVRKLK